MHLFDQEKSNWITHAYHICVLSFAKCQHSIGVKYLQVTFSTHFVALTSYQNSSNFSSHLLYPIQKKKMSLHVDIASYNISPIWLVYQVLFLHNIIVNKHYVWACSNRGRWTCMKPQMYGDYAFWKSNFMHITYNFELKCAQTTSIALATLAQIH